MDNQENEYKIPKEETSIFSEDDFSIGIYDRHIRRARNAIFACAGILLLSLIILAASLPPGYNDFWMDAIFWGVFIAGFIALGLWTKKKPYYAIIGALILYGISIAINGFLDPVTIIKGIIFKIIIIVLLIKGLSDAKAAQEMQKIRR